MRAHQRGVVMLLSLLLSLLLGLLATSALRKAMSEPRQTALVLRNALALEQAEATLLEALTGLTHAPPPCQACAPPSRPHALQGSWQRSHSGYFQLQNLGASDRAAYLPEDERVLLIRITAVSLQAQSRHVLEAVYALRADQQQAPQRVLWRQRLKED